LESRDRALLRLFFDLALAPHKVRGLDLADLDTAGSHLLVETSHRKGPREKVPIPLPPGLAVALWRG
jgi:site-specific recombinase XerC